MYIQGSAWYKRKSVITIKIWLLSINMHCLYFLQHAFQHTKIQSLGTILGKPTYLPPKGSKPCQKWLGIEGKHLKNRIEVQQRHSRNWKAPISLIKPG